jgi:hypothetical protein
VQHSLRLHLLNTVLILTTAYCRIPAATDSSSIDTTIVVEKEAMEIGGLVTVDAAGDPTYKSSASVQVGQVALSANVNIAEGITASITVLAEENMSALSIDQAVVQVAPGEKPFVFLFGQQAFNFGLLTTRLISDPMLIDNVETQGPGLAANFEWGIFTPGAGITYTHTNEETARTYRINFTDSTIVATDSITKPESDLFTGVINCDITLPNESVARFAARFSGDIIDLTLGTGFSAGPLTFDVELYSQVLTDEDDLTGGYYAGASWSFNDLVQAAVRYDGLSENSFNEIIHRIGFGTTISFKHGIFCAAEYSIDDMGSRTPHQEIALQVGLESTIKLPGFQRKTLTRK